MKRHIQISMSELLPLEVYAFRLTLSALLTNTVIQSNNVDPDEMAQNEPSHQDLHRLPFFLL